MPDEVVRKYDAIASDYSSRYADPEAVVAFYLGLVGTWGTPAGTGATVLEVSCADGFMTEGLARAGYRVTALDISPAMVERAGSRLAAAGLQGDLRVADIRSWEPDGRWDVVLAPMWTFFHYAGDAEAVLARLAGAADVKVIVDLNPRERAIADGVASMRNAGLRHVNWRPVPIPLTRRLGTVGRTTLRAALSVPMVRDAVLRRRFNVALGGDVAQR